MKIEVRKINSIQMSALSPGKNLTLDVDICNADDILSALWDLYGDDFILSRLAKEGYDVLPKAISN
jgi:hypothetical protein